MGRLFLIISFLFVSACSKQTVHIYPHGDYLKNAKVGQPYNELIKIPGVIDISFFAEITPSNSGLTWTPSDYTVPVKPITAKDYSRIKIQGTPTHAGEIRIKVAGGIYGTMLNGANEFEKTYTIKVNE
ncbi:hypothetical protein Xmau_03246 [Xenorhabdus mauleonii]|uniref:Lipoprotein n=1 Tax=Xenorhabdus mauleonii TaxID=351675 RepID=A0A1I3W210_9GAMM|nr:hypothetical protein [Xenorhabdus mauleonii]PHM38870.1 hypothetical protein Xmau_03246 [Xenorhabdus mauleonii]SFK01515.1 hypothetical protein SAMN05421680_1243 [Xenorhabdus mauleonii]